MSRYTLSPVAAADLSALADHYTENFPRYAERLARELRATFRLLGRLPGLGTPRPELRPGLRSKAVRDIKRALGMSVGDEPRRDAGRRPPRPTGGPRPANGQRRGRHPGVLDREHPGPAGRGVHRPAAGRDPAGVRGPS